MSDGPTHIVGVGASAGGLSALERFFAAMPEETGLAFVVVQHLSPDFKSVMDDLLGRVTRIPIQVMADEMQLRANSIYLLPPNQEVICSNRRLLLSERSRTRELSFPIDQFFRSLAEDAGPAAVAVVLSGSGTDGSRGVCHVHEAGGLVIAQSPDTADFDGMPQSAIATGIVDLTLAPERICEALHQHSLRSQGEPAPHDPSPIAQVFALVKEHSGVDFADYKQTTIGRRIHRRVMLAGLGNVGEYLKTLEGDTREIDRLYHDLLIGVTSFFRDRDAFERLEIDIIPSLLDRLEPHQEVRVWSVGTATGEEAYSIAIILHECLSRRGEERAVRVFATDVHRGSLGVGSRGVYTQDQLTHVTPQRLERYFVPTDDAYQVSPQLRNSVVFVQHNMVRDAPFTRIDLVLCRNVLIYLEPSAQKRALSFFHFALKSDAVLCLGSSESLGDWGEEFTTIDEPNRIYRKRRDIKAPASLTFASPVRPRVDFPTPMADRIASSSDKIKLMEAYDALLNEYAPPSLLVAPDGRLLHAFPGVEPFLLPPAGRLTSNVLDFVRPEFRATLAASIRRVKDRRESVAFGGVTCTLDGEPTSCRVACSLLRSRTENEHLLISFTVEKPILPSEPVETIDARGVFGDEFVALERELQESRNNLQAMIEQLQSTNEELQAANEQLIASNEELQSTNEELHSVNEELYTVNAEHSRKISELTELTNDMDNLLASTSVHTIFLDGDLRIRRFTPGIAATFNLISQDLGRRIDSFAYNLVECDLAREIRQVLATSQPVEREVRDRDDHWYLMRILPYMCEGDVAGIVLTLVEITSLKDAERRLAEVSDIVEHCDDAITRLSPDGTVLTWNNGAAALYGFSREEIVGRSFEQLAPEHVRQENLAILAHTVQGVAVERFETQRQRKDGEIIDVAVTMSPIRDEKDEVVGVSEVVRDITAQKRAEQEVRAAVGHRDEFLAMLSHELRNPVAAVLNATALMDTDGADPDMEREARIVVSRNVRHVGRLLDDLLDLSRFTHNKISLQQRVVDLKALAPVVVECVQPLIAERDQELRLELDSRSCIVLGDLGRIQQAQVNLLVNASKYTPPRGKITFAIELQGPNAVIRVTDNGIGIRAELLHDIFKPFIQSQQSLDRSRGGMGLGLPLVKMIVEAHGGSVTARSGGVSMGSEFVVRLPTTKQDVPAILDATPPTAGETVHRLVLVEDNEGIRRMLAATLRLKGLDVTTAADASSGLDAILDITPDIALIDIGLPDTDGYQLARQIRQKPQLNATLLVAVTGYGREEDRRRARESGFDLHLVKPLDPDEVIVEVERALGLRTETPSPENEPGMTTVRRGEDTKTDGKLETHGG